MLSAQLVFAGDGGVAAAYAEVAVQDGAGYFAQGAAVTGFFAVDHHCHLGIVCRCVAHKGTVIRGVGNAGLGGTGFGTDSDGIDFVDLF